MSQQGMEFEGIAHDGPKSSYTGGYEGIPHATTPSYGQKVFSGHSKAAPSGQRLALAIVSLSLLVLMFIMDMLIASNLPWYNSSVPSYTIFFALIFMFVIFTVAIIIVNFIFNRKD